LRPIDHKRRILLCIVVGVCLLPQTNVPGEQTSPTQPFPRLPAAIVPQKLSEDDAWGLTPAEREECRKIIASARSEGLFTPPSLQGTIVFPGNVGGLNWSGMSYDPRRALLIANTNRLATLVRLIPNGDLLTWAARW
jgi:quinoprotein glucose dehydrogenase